MSASIVLSQDLTNATPGLNLKWVVSNMGTIKELSMVYYQNTSNADILFKDIAPSYTKTNFNNLESGISYSFQLQCVDINEVTIYSNLLVLTSSYMLSSPSILSYVGLDNSVKITLNTTTNILTSNDTVEFVLKRQSDNVLFWIIKPYSSTKIYTLSVDDDARLSNSNIYRVSCMFQPATNNAYYLAPSSMSNTITVEPSNLPNVVSNVVLSSESITNNLNLKVSWNRPSDLNEWVDNDFSILLTLIDSLLNETLITLSNQNVAEYTFNNLNRGVAYSVKIQYVNVFGEGVAYTSDYFGALKSTPDAPILNSVVPGDQITDLSWTLPEYTGQCDLTAILVYKNDALIATLGATETSYQATTLVNGSSYTFYVKAVNEIGQSVPSDPITVIPYGDIIISNVQIISGKTLSVNINPNGRVVDRVIFFCVDSDPNEAKSDLFHEFLLSNGTVPNQLNSFVLSKTFLFSSDINFYGVIANNDTSCAFVHL